MPYLDKTKKRAYQRSLRADRRRQWVETNGPCKKCGSWEKIEVDHVDKATKVSHRIWSWSDKRREAELKKCQPLCRQCHLEKSRQERQKPLIHGTQHAYRYRGCRCDACNSAHSVYMQPYVENRNVERRKGP